MVEAGAFKQCTSLTRIHIPASMVTHGYVGESPAYPGIFAADDGHLCERDRKDRQVQNSPSAQTATLRPLHFVPTLNAHQNEAETIEN